MWSKLNKYQQYEFCKKASNLAKSRLSQVKKRTGVGILGTASDQVRSDPKIQGDFLKDSIVVGECYALQSLTAEYLVLLLCESPKKD